MQAPATSRRGGVKATGTELAAALEESRGTKKIWDNLTPSQFVQRLRTALKGKTFTTAELEEVDRDLLDDAVHALTGVGRDDDDPVSKLADDFMASWNQTESFASPLPKTVPPATPNRPRRSPSPRREASPPGGATLRDLFGKQGTPQNPHRPIPRHKNQATPRPNVTPVAEGNARRTFAAVAREAAESGSTREDPLVASEIAQRAHTWTPKPNEIRALQEAFSKLGIYTLKDLEFFQPGDVTASGITVGTTKRMFRDLSQAPGSDQSFMENRGPNFHREEQQGDRFIPTLGQESRAGETPLPPTPSAAGRGAGENWECNISTRT